MTADDDAPLKLTVAPEEGGATVLSVLGERFVDAPTAGLRRLVQGEEVLLNGRACGPRQSLAAGDRLEVWTDLLERIDPAPLDGFAVLHEEADLLACAKPPGVSVEADRGEGSRPFKAAVLHHLRGEGEERRPRLVHRLDRDTSGVVLVATTRRGLQSLTRQLEERTVRKEYLALVRGAPRDDEGVVDRPVARRGKRGRSDEDARPAVTRWRVEERFTRHALLRAFPETGRQHQVRQHMAALGHPLAVDPTYGGGRRLLLSDLKRDYRPRRGSEERPLIERLTLHAHRVAFRPPARGEEVTVEAPLPEDLRIALKQLRKYDPAPYTTG